MVTISPLALAATLIAGSFAVTDPAISGAEEDLIQLLESRQCSACQLNDADLTHADLRDAVLKGAHVRRANLSQAQLDGADLRNSDLRFTSLQGASLRGADLRNSNLIGTDLRHADLTGALLDQHALDQAHWDGARGVADGARSHAGLHNAGVEAAQAGRWPMAEQLFNAAIEAQPDEPLIWLARGLSRGEQGKADLASRDFAYDGELFPKQGDMVNANQLKEASRRVYDSPDSRDNPRGNGVGSTLISGALSTVQALAPIAFKTLMPMIR